MRGREPDLALALVRVLVPAQVLALEYQLS